MQEHAQGKHTQKNAKKREGMLHQHGQPFQGMPEGKEMETCNFEGNASSNTEVSHSRACLCMKLQSLRGASSFAWSNGKGKVHRNRAVGTTQSNESWKMCRTECQRGGDALLMCAQACYLGRRSIKAGGHRISGKESSIIICGAIICGCSIMTASSKQRMQNQTGN
eukprot:scaffold17285_cov19-Tisochrysis_lutea.AAC.3